MYNIGVLGNVLVDLQTNFKISNNKYYVHKIIINKYFM